MISLTHRRSTLAVLGAAIATCLAQPSAASAANKQYVELPTIVLIYAHYYHSEDVRVDLTPAEIAAVEDVVEYNRQRYWRGSSLMMDMKPDYLVVERTLTPADMHDYGNGDGAYWLQFWWERPGGQAVIDDLREAGIVAGQYAVVMSPYAFTETEGPPKAVCAFGGGTIGPHGDLLGGAAYVGIPLCGCAGDLRETIGHEYNHAIDSIFTASGLDKFYYNGDWAPIFRHLCDCVSHFNYALADAPQPPSLWLQLDPFYAHVVTAPDADGDGVPDTGTAPITEAAFGSDPHNPDTDGDGLSDLDELRASFYAPSDPRNPDTDSDGLRDGVDPYPLWVCNARIAPSTPLLDGYIRPGEYTRVTQVRAGDPDFSAKVYAAWTPGAMCFAAEVTDDVRSVFGIGDGIIHSLSDHFQVWIDLDENGYWYQGRENYEITSVPRDVDRPETIACDFWADLTTGEHGGPISLGNLGQAGRAWNGGYAIELRIPTGSLESLLPAYFNAWMGARLRVTFRFMDFDAYEDGWWTVNAITGSADATGDVDDGFVMLRFLPKPGDCDCSGVTNFDDINPFVAALVSRTTYESQHPACHWLSADCNDDGTVDFDDINPFVTLLVNP